ncbi:MAG: diguanylate cyclase [Burkholderiales bacterium]|nr:diguanylate cyclase [Burkholderiales bacterium]
MSNVFSQLFGAGAFVPHGYCFAWSPGLLNLFVVANSAICLAYFSLPIFLITLSRRRPDMRAGKMLWMFAAFIFLCGLTHLLDIITIWYPLYWLTGWVELATGVISIGTAVLLWRTLPRLIALPSTSQLADANRKLSEQMDAYRSQEAALRASEERYRELSESLDIKVRSRTAELADANNRLQREIDDRERTQYELELSNRKLEQALRQQAARSNDMEQLNRMGDLLQSCVAMTELTQVLSSFAAGYLDAAMGAIYVIDSQDDIATVTASWGDLPEVERVIPTASCWGLRRGQIHPADQLQQGLVCQHVSDGSEHCCIPLIANGETLGLLHLRRQHEHHDLAFLDGVAKRAALAMIGMRTREALFNDATHDPLTGLFNRRHLDEELHEAERRARRSNRPVGVMMLDIDHFKLINDTYGHEVGDTVLREVAECLRAGLRSGDVACRYGGEEFTVLLAGANLQVTQQRAEHFRQIVEGMTIPYRDVIIRITLSVGIAAFPESADHIGQVLSLADQALYSAKHGGRNRVAYV